MMEYVLPTIPRAYTALAQWSACLTFILMNRKRLSKWKIALISVAALIVLSIFLVVTDNVVILFWVPCMVLAYLGMTGYIYSCCKLKGKEAFYFSMHAFVISEFVASFDSLLYNFSSMDGNLYAYIETVVPSNIVSFADLILTCILTNLVVFLLYRRYIPKDGRFDFVQKDIYMTLFIGILVFAASNLSFLTKNTIISGTYYLEILKLHMVIDLSGIAILYAHYVRCRETSILHELEAVQNVLQNQYHQYKQSRESIELINYKYHDLKHQISVLRAEEDPQKRHAFLDKMEEEIKQYELQNKTGNKVLDTVLTSKSMYCDKHGITLTCVADGSLLDFMDTMDICSIFGNALDNAIECELKIADKEKRLIHVTVSHQKQFLLIRVENYFEGDLTYKEGKLATTKREKDFHGYGIKSIKYTAEKYDGAVTIDTDNQWFDMKILIPLS